MGAVADFVFVFVTRVNVCIAAAIANTPAVYYKAQGRGLGATLGQGPVSRAFNCHLEDLLTKRIE